MATVRQVTVTKEGKTWSWRLGKRFWQFRLEPKAGLWRDGATLTAVAQGVPLLCPDDAVIFAKGWESGHLVQGEFDDAPTPKKGKEAAR